MASARSKAIWEISAPFPAFVLERASQRITAEPIASAGVGWQLLELLNRANQALIAPGNTVEQIRKAINRETLVATGIRVLPSRSQTPVVIAPATISRGRFLPMQNALIGSGFRYDDVRVIRKTDILSALRSHRPNQSSRSSEITREIVALHKSGQLAGLRKQQVFVVRDKLAEAGIENIGTDKTVERLIRQSLKLEKRR